MKKLLALVLSFAMLLTMFSGVISVSAADASAATRYAYNGSMPQSSAATWGFEDASLLTPTAEQNNMYMIGGANGATPWNDNSGITTDEKYSGNASLYATFDGAGYSHYLVDVKNPADLAAWVDPSKYYDVRADIKTTADFNGGIYFHLIKDGTNVGVHPWYGEYIFYQSAVDGVYTKWGSRTGLNHSRSPFWSNLVADWTTGSKVQIRIMITGDAGSVWIDNFELIPVLYGRGDTSIGGNVYYDGVFTAENTNLAGDNVDKVGPSNNGGFERTAGYWNSTMMTDRNSTQNFGFVNWGTDVIANPIPDKAGTGVVTYEQAHYGNNSLKVYKTADTRAGYAFYLPKEGFINAEKDYYLEAYVKLDTFVGSIEAAIANPAYNTINATYPWYGSNFMLGSANNYVSAEDVGNGWLHVTSQIMSGATIAENAGEVLNFYMIFNGTGVLYVDDFNLVEVNEYTPKVSVKNFHSNVAFDKVEITTESENADVWFTTDGTDPLTSATAMRYDAANPIRVYDGLNLKVVGIDKATGAASAEISQHYSAPANLFKLRTADPDDKANLYYDVLTLPADAAAGEEVRLTFDQAAAVMQFYGYNMNNSVKFTFDVTAAEDFTGETWVKLFLNGGGEFRVDFNDTSAAGTFVGRNGYVAKVTEPGTQTVTVELEDLQAHDAMAPFIERISGSGAVTVDNFKIVIDQIGKGIIDVVEEEAPELDYYIEGYYTDVFPLFVNNSAYHLVGKMDVIYTAQDGNDKFVKSYDVDLAPGASNGGDWFDISEVITEYGAYDLQYVFTDSYGIQNVCLEKTIAYLPDNSASESFRGVNLGVFGFGYNKTYAQLELVKNLGMNYVRSEIRIDNVTVAEDGTYTLAQSVLDGARAAQDAGIKLVVLLNASTSSVVVDDYVKFATDVKAQLADYGVEYYEIINEPNGGANAAKYAQIVKAAYPVLADDTTKVLAGNVSHHGGGYLETMIETEADILDYMDIWAVHPYVHNNFSETATWEDATFNEYLAEIKAKYLDPNGIELWAGEFGYPTADTCQRDYTGLYPFVTEDVVAEYTLRQYLGLEAAGYGAAIQYVYDGNNNYWGEQSFGLVNKDNKTTVAALSVYTAFTEGYDFVGQTVTDGAYVNKYENAEGEVVYAVWTTEGKKDVVVAVPGYEYGVANMYGKKADALKVSNANGYDLTVEATTEPTWVVDYVAPYVEPASTEYIQNASVESEKLNGSGHNITDGVDTVVKFDGNQSYKAVMGASGWTRRSMVFNLSNIDVSKLYVLRYKYKTENIQLNSNTFIVSSGITYLNNFYNGEFELGAITWTEPRTTNGWETYESTPFSIASTTGSFVFDVQWSNSSTETGTLWIDRFELVPVDDTNNHGKVTLSVGDDGKVYATATPDDGYAVKNFTAQGQSLNYETYKRDVYAMKHSFVSEDIATRAKTYLVEYVAANDETVPVNTFFKNAGYVYFSASFVPASEMPIAVLGDDAILNNGSLETKPVFWTGGESAHLDANVAVDGDYSLRLDYTQGSNAGHTFLLGVPVEKMATLDTSVHYKLRFYVKSGGTFNGFVGLDAYSYGNTADGSSNVELLEYGWWWGSDMPLLNTGTIGDKWTKFESAAFPLIGDSASIRLAFNNGVALTEESVWIDRVELVPVEREKNYTVTTKYDANLGKVVATVKAADGYMPTGLTVTTDTGIGSVQAVAGTATVVGKPSVNEVSYAIDFASNAFTYGTGYNIFDATVAEIPAADAETIIVGDATGDGEVDILDLVRFKNFELGNTADINYVNVWYDREDNVLGATDFAALRKQIWALF